MPALERPSLNIDDLPDAHVVIGADGEVLMESASARLLAEGIMAEVGALGSESLSFDLPLPSGRCLRAQGREISWQGSSARVFRLIDATDAVVNEVRQHQIERLELLGVLAIGIAHDFNNLLTVVIANAEHLSAIRTIQETHQAPDVLAETVTVAQRGARMVQRLLSFSRVERVTPKPARVDQIVRETASMLRRLLPRSVRIDLSIQSSTNGLWGLADASAVQQVLFNLATNARDALRTTEDAVVTISVRRVGEEGSDDAWVEVVVADNGEGIPPENRRRVFEPFFTTKELGGGSGLGLAMVRSIMREHDGAVRLKSEVGVGTAVTLGFLGCDAESEPQSEGLPEWEGGGGRVLLVEGDPSVRNVIARVLTRAGYLTDTCADVPEAHLALARTRRRGDRVFDLVICERHIDGGVGQLLGILEQLALRSPILIFSDEDDLLEASFPCASGRQVMTLAKPWRTSDLLSCARSLLLRGTPPGSMNDGSELPTSCMSSSG